MPVIRVDDEIWKELQKRAEPLIDTPNSVLRRILFPETPVVNVAPEEIEITLNSLHSPKSFALIPIRKHRAFFPGFKTSFLFETDLGPITTRVTSAPAGTPVGDPNGGSFIQGGLRPWYDKHTELEEGDKLKIESLEPGKKYRLSIVKKPKQKPY